MVAISPQLPKYSRELAFQHKLSFPVLHDSHNEVARKFGLVFRLPEDLQNAYRSFGIDLEKVNGDPSWELPIPGSFVIARDGLVKYASADPDYTTRPEPDALIEAVKEASSIAAD